MTPRILTPATPIFIQARFRRVDDEFRALMSSIVDDPRVFSVLKVPQLVT